MADPMYRRIADDLREQIESGDLEPGQQLRTEFELRDHYKASRNTVRDAINNYSANVQACHGQLTCVTSLDRRVAATLNTSAGQLGAIPIPSRATAADAALAAAVSHTASIFARLGTATSVSQYNAILSSAGLRQAVDQINQAYTNLGNALGA